MKKPQIWRSVWFTILFFLLINFISTKQLFGVDVLGSDISWIGAGKDSFIVSYEVITDCRSVSTNTVTLSFRYKNSGTLVRQEILTAKSSIDVTGSCFNQCTKCDVGCSGFGYGFKKLTFTKLFIFSNLQDCELIVYPGTESRPYSINTGLGGKGFYTYAIINTCISDSNRSPVFSGVKTILGCVTSDFIFDPEAINPTNDSLVFTLVSPLNDSVNVLSYSGQFAFDKPLEFWGFPNANLNYPLGFKIDSKTGIITFRAMKACETMFSVGVKIYRKGQLIGETRREMGVIAIACPINNFPVITGTSVASVCAGSEIKLDFSSKDIDTDDSVKFYIVHRLNNISWQTSNEIKKQATAEFRWTPERSYISKNPYEVYILAKDNNCPVGAQVVRRLLIHVFPDTLKADLLITKKDCGEYEFKAQLPSNLNNYHSVWIGNGNLYSTNDSFVFKYHKPGNYFVNYTIVADSACSENQIKYIQTDSFLFVDLPPDTNVCFGDSISLFTQTGFSKGKINYYWNTGDTVSTINTGAVTYPLTYSVFVSDSGYCTSSDTIAINPGSFIFFYSIPDLCDNEDSFNINTFVSPLGGMWSCLNKTFLNSKSNYIHPRKVGKGQYWLKYEYLDSASNCLSVDSILITVNQSPLASSVNTLPLPVLCRNSSPLDLNPYGVPSGGDWRCSTISGESNNILYPNNLYSGTFRMFYTWYNQFGCEYTDTQTIYINPTVNMTFNTEDNKTTYCNDKQKVKLNATPAGGTIICTGWIIDSCYFSPALQKDSFTQVKATYQYKHSSGCEVERVLNLNVFHKPQVEILELKSLYPEEIKPSVAINATFRYAQNVQWNLVPDKASGSVSPSYFIKKIDYTPSLADYNRSLFTLAIATTGHNNQCTAARDTQTFIICNSLNVDFKFSDKNPYIDSLVKFTDLSSDKAFEVSTWKWYFGDGDSSELKNPNYYYQTKGKYYVNLLIGNQHGCMATKTDSLLVREYIGINETERMNYLKVLNLNNEYIIQFLDEKKSAQKIVIFNALGQRVSILKPVIKNEFILNKSDINSGIYLLKIEFENDLPLVIKLLM